VGRSPLLPLDWVEDSPTPTIQGEGETMARRICQMLTEWADDLAIVPKDGATGRSAARRSATGWSLAKRLCSRACRREQDARPLAQGALVEMRTVLKSRRRNGASETNG
jgi:hypothetical protein